VEGVGAREILTAREFGRLWGVKTRVVLGHMLWLRSLGFEVRNHNTNPQIKPGAYLIPYAFPTLGPMSVQLRKSLVPPKDKAQG
jgi:DNA (cytosine-5)-methyltransferase 1